MDSLRFEDITPIEVPVHIHGVDYVLRETSGEAAVKYNDARLACNEYQDGKLVRVHGLADLEPLLVSLCLFTQEGSLVSKTTILGWPARVQKALYDKAREISGMNETPQSLRKQIELLQRQLTEVEEQERLSKN
jgi:hypothetical protein